MQEYTIISTETHKIGKAKYGSGLTPIQALLPENRHHSPDAPRNLGFVHRNGVRTPQVVRTRQLDGICKVVAPFRGEILGDWGLVGEWLFGDQPEEIVLRVAVPAAETKFSRLGRGRVEVDEDTRERGSGTPGNEQGEQCCCFWKKVVGRCSAAEEVALSGKSPAPDKPRSRNLQHLPIELLWMIFSYISLDELYSLTLTTPLLCHITTPILTSRFRNDLGTWANTPLFCGRRSMQNFNHTYQHLNTIGGPETSIEYGCFINSVQGLFQKYGIVVDLNKCYEDISDSRPRLPRIPVPTTQSNSIASNIWQTQSYGQGWRHPRQVLSLPDLFPPNKEFVLRNLTHRQYVRGNLLTDTHNAGVRARHPIWGWGLGHVIASRAMLAEDYLLKLYTEGFEEPHFGRFNGRGWFSKKSWAGCRFDIRVWEEVEEEVMRGVISPGEGDVDAEGREGDQKRRKQKWKDVTEECKSYLDFLWRANGPKKESTEVWLSTSEGLLEAD